MSWITEIKYENADGELKKIYDQMKNSQGRVDNVLSVHSLRVPSMIGHLSLYKNVLHHAGNTVPKWFLETLGVYVSHLNNCNYCKTHHFVGMKKLLQDENKSQQIFNCIQNDSLQDHFEGKFLEAILYARKLTRTPDAIKESDIANLRTLGFSDGEILEINQVISYFNYVNRTVLGLGVELEVEQEK